MIDPEVLITAILLSAASAIAGVYLVLGKQSMYGDALSHSILPGIVVMYVISGERSFSGSLVGAVITGVVVSLLIERLQQIRGIPQDAAIGTIFVVFFALGVVLISGPAAGVDLDQDCVLFGEIAFVPFERVHLGAYDLGAKGIWISGFLLVISSLFQFLFGRIMTLTTFQSEFAHSVGINPRMMKIVYSIFVSVVVVLAFELVGVILVISLLVTPAATAWLYSKRLGVLITTSVLIAVATTLTGVLSADLADVSISGSIATVQGIVFLGSASVYAHRYSRRVKKIH
ncbi:MAG: metal ABC transporter permease [Thermaurantimonas sp.]